MPRDWAELLNEKREKPTAILSLKVE